MCYMTRQLLPSPSEGALIRGAGEGASLPVSAAERIPERCGTRLPIPHVPEGIKAPCFSHFPPKCGVPGTGETAGAGGSHSGLAHGAVVESEHGPGGVLPAGLPAVRFNPSA